MCEFLGKQNSFSFCQRQLLNARCDTYNRLPTALTDVYGSYLNPLKNRTIEMWSQKYECADWYFSSLPFLTYFPSKNSLAWSLASCNPWLNLCYTQKTKTSLSLVLSTHSAFAEFFFSLRSFPANQNYILNLDFNENLSEKYHHQQVLVGHNINAPQSCFRFSKWLNNFPSR